nr:DUF3667 domain-containing protein [uncultured Draconibacterium sp.]
MSDLPKPIQCPTCSSTAIDNYCSNCGQKIYHKRFTLKGFFSVVGNALNLERGFLHTMVWMFRNPGKVIDDYLYGRTKPYLNPLNYIIIISGVYAFIVLSLNILDSGVETINHLSGIDQLNSSPEATQLQEQWMETVKKYTNFIPLLMLPFSSLASKWYFRRKRLYYGEHLILNTYVLAHSILITIILAPLVLVIPGLLPIFTLVNLCFTFSYLTYAFRSYFKRSVFNAFAGTVFVYLVGVVLLMLIGFLIATILIFTMIALGGTPFGLAG